MIAVVNSSPIILLAEIHRLDLLRNLFDEVLIPQAVLEEITVRRDLPGAAERGAPWIGVRQAADQPAVEDLATDLGRGESEAIVLAHEVGMPVVQIMDAAAGRRRALQRGLTVLGSAGLLALAKERNLIPLVRPVLDDLRAAGLYLSDAVYRRLLAGGGEAPDEVR